MTSIIKILTILIMQYFGESPIKSFLPTSTPTPLSSIRS